MERRPKWAFHLYPWSDSLWQLQYHSDIVDHILDPRRHDTSKINTPEPLSSATKPKYWDPSKTTAPPKQSLERAAYDERLYQMVFGRVVRRAPSQDNMFLLPDGCDSPSLIYRTKPYEQQSVYAPRNESERLHFSVLNATQFKFYKSAAEKETESKNWLRVGSLFSDFVEASHRIEQGDVSDSDAQGLSYQLEKRILENQAGPVGERWSNQQLLRGRYYVDSIVKSMDPRTKFFRADLFIINRHNHPNPQSWGMDAFTTVIVRRKRPGDKPRNDKPCQVLMELSRFENLCPQYEDRQLLRMLLGRGDDLRSSSYLLSPYDAAKLSQSMLIIPRQEREVTVFKATLSGAPIGTVMVSTQNSDHRVYSDELPFPDPDQALARYDSAEPSSKENQLMKKAVSTSASAHSTYKSASNGFPSQLLESTNKSSSINKEVKQRSDAQKSNQKSVKINDGKAQSDSEVQNNGKVTTDKVVGSKNVPEEEDDASETKAVLKVSAAPANPDTSSPEGNKDAPELTTMDKINLSLSHETQYSGPFDRLQKAYSRIVDPVPHTSLENFPTWLYVFSNASQEAQKGKDKEIDFSPLAEMRDYADELPVGYPLLPVPQPEHTCAVDPRGSEPPHLVHPPMALASRLYDNYDSAEERDDHELFQVFTPLNLSERSSPGSPMLFSGLETPEDDSESEECISPHPEPIPTIIDDSAPPMVMSTPQKSSAENPGATSELPSPRTFGPYQQGPPRHRFPELEDFSMENGAAVHTCETHSQHLANLLYMFQSRIIHRGTRQELFTLAMTYPATKMYLRSARCLRGLTEDQIKRIIGPFSQEQLAAFNAKFNPGRLEYTRRIEDFDRLYEICVPDTSADFEPIIPIPPAFKYMKEKELREILFNRQLPDPRRPRFGRTPSTAEYVTESITPSDASTEIYSTTTETTVSDINLEDYVLHHGTYSNGQSQTQHFLGEIWGPYFEGSVLKDIPLDVSFEEFISELDSQMAHGPIHFVPGAAPVGADDPAAELSILWACQQLSIQGLVNPGMIAGGDFSGDIAETEGVRVRVRAELFTIFDRL